MFDNWGMQIDHIIKLQVIMLVAMNEGNDLQVALLYKNLIEEREESKKFRDHIDRELFKAW